MERERKESSKGSAVAAGITCSVIGALLGAVGYHFWKKEEVKLSHSEPKKVFKDRRCPICLSDFEELRVLPCGHQYHKDCMKQEEAVNRNLKCPVCRQEYRIDDSAEGDASSKH